MVYDRVKKNSSSWNPAFGQEKTESLFRPQRNSFQPEADTDSTAEPEIPTYSRVARDAIYAKVLKSMEVDGKSLAQTPSPNPQSESRKSESDKVSAETVSLQRTSELPLDGDEEENPAKGGTIQRLCDKCESQQHE